MSTSVARRYLLCCFLAMSCRGKAEPGRDTATVAAEESPGALAERHEAQSCLDSARTAFVRGDSERCITELAAAAAYFRIQSQAAEPDARPALAEAAEEIETFLANVARRRSRTPRDLDRVYAQAHAAESGMHLSHARSAMARNDSGRAGEELVMSIDHLERAARDARRPGDSAVRKAVADTRPLATKMIEGTSVPPDAVTRAARAIEAAIQRIVASVETPRLKAP